MRRNVAHRAAQATAVAALGVPGILLAHLLTTGVPAGPRAAAAVTLAVVALAAALPGRTTAGLAGVTAATQVAGHGVLALVAAGGASAAGCLPVVGHGASIGLKLALLRADAGCPAGTLAPGPTAGAAAAALTAVLGALTVVAGHALAAALTGLLLGVARRGVRSARTLRMTGATAITQVAALLLRLFAPRIPGMLPAPGGVRPDTAVAPVLVPQHHPAATRLRGPPLGAARAPVLG